MARFRLANLLFLQTFATAVVTANADEEMMKPYMLPIPPNNHGIQPKVLIDEEIEISPDNLLTTIPILSTEWSVSINVRLLKYPNGWGNVFSFSNHPKNRSFTYGVRTPFVTFSPQSKAFFICSAVNGGWNYCFNHGTINLNQKYHLEIHQRYIANGKYRYYIIVDGVEIHSVVNTDARQFYNVYVYASNQRGGTPKDFYISNFKCVNFL